MFVVEIPIIFDRNTPRLHNMPLTMIVQIGCPDPDPSWPSYQSTIARSQLGWQSRIFRGMAPSWPNRIHLRSRFPGWPMSHLKGTCRWNLHFTSGMFIQTYQGIHWNTMVMAPSNVSAHLMCFRDLANKVHVGVVIYLANGQNGNDERWKCIKQRYKNDQKWQLFTPLKSDIVVFWQYENIWKPSLDLHLRYRCWLMTLVDDPGKSAIPRIFPHGYQLPQGCSVGFPLVGDFEGLPTENQQSQHHSAPFCDSRHQGQVKLYHRKNCYGLSTSTNYLELCIELW